MSILSYLNKLIKTTGYVYMPLGEDTRFDTAIKGAKIENDTFSPPWIIINKHLKNTTLTNWPGNLFEVEALKPAEEEHINTQKGVSYIRTCGVKILKKLPSDLLFGKNGNGVVELLNTVDSINKENAEQIANLWTEEAKEVYSYAWDVWLGDDTNNPNYTSNKHFDTLKSYSKKHESNSPMNEGFSLIYSQIHKRAITILGDVATTTDSENNVIINPTWAKISEVFLHAAMSYEDKNILSEKEKSILKNPILNFLNNQ